ncbi:NYN domain-containing protein [uncultured Chitinophaga sp.]|uniref:NYN domain-containing protein n=1 Tax=uncultured Chitinophaga sp. TaxID=339340 RepID=UPI0025D3C431|nr:NYN domain-containing protein [uncultured Chitinophaga sp.]
MLLENAITPMQQYSYTSGKNSTDSAMIIDAMDILYSDNVDGFCIISSDSDFTRLAIRLRESGKLVIGMGEKKTPMPFISACDKFVYVEILGNKDAESVVEEPHPGKKREKKSESSIKTIDKKLIALIASSVSDLANEEGWAFLGDIGNLILKKQRDFDPRNYGFKKLAPLIKSIGKFEADERLSDKEKNKLVFIRLKP